MAGMWTGVRGRVDALRALPGSDQVFGVSTHDFTLSSPLPEAAVIDAERQFDARFPDAYRSFLTEVSAGGAGPGYGLLSLTRVDGRWRWTGSAAKPSEEVDPRVPFPHRDTFHFDWWADLEAAPERANFANDADYESAMVTYRRKVEALDARDIGATFGTITLCHLGCGYFDLLVVNGPDRGVVWSDCEAADGGVSPQVDNQGRVTFDRWYLSWLAKAEIAAQT